MRKQPLVSICVPIRNEERHLAEALDSLLAQDCEETEIIICDNASTDATQDICLAYARRSPKIRYHREDIDRGAPANFTRAFGMSSGKYATFASGHDTRPPSAIRRCVEELEANPNLVLCYPRTMLIPFVVGPPEDMDGDTLETMGLPTSGRLKHVIMRLGYGNAVYGVVRSSALANVKFEVSYWADLSLLSQLSLVGEFHQIEDRLFIRRQNRPPESRQEITSRQYAMMDPASSRTAPRSLHGAKWLMLMRVVGRSKLHWVDKLLLMLRVTLWIGAHAGAGSVSAHFPRMRQFYLRHPALVRIWRSLWRTGAS